VKKKKRKWIKWIVLAILVAGIAVWLGVVSQKTQSAVYTEEPVTTGDLTTYYNFDGLVKAPLRQTLTAAETDTVRTVYVQQNQQVDQGTRLYRTENGTTVEADMAGEVTGLYIEEGSVVSAGDKTVEIMDLSRLTVELDVDEYDIAAVTPGTEAEITVLALGDTFTGTVTALDKNGTASGDLSYYTATLDLPQSEGVYPGMQVSAKVLRDHAENATLIKMDAIQFDEYNMPYVYMRASDGKDVVQVPVTVGVNDGIYCQITDGLRAGETILKPSSVSVAQLLQQMRDAGR